MLLEKVESALDLDVNVITRKVEKHLLCEVKYEPKILPLHLSSKEIDKITYHYLSTSTGIHVNGGQFTTISKVTLYGKENKVMNNPKLYVTCDSKKYDIGFVNDLHYLHLPDYVLAEVLNSGGEAFVVKHKHILELGNNSMLVYTHKEEIPSPYYVFKTPFDYYENANMLAEIIGAFDVWKRGYIKNGKIEDVNKALFYFLYPYVSLVIYKRTQTTLYPALIKPLVSTILDKVRRSALEVLEKYTEKPLVLLERVINAYNTRGQPILEVY